MKEAIGAPVVAELKRITKLLALSLVKNEVSSREQIKLLDQYDFSQKEISEMLHIPLGTVGINLARAKQSELKKGQGKKS